MSLPCSTEWARTYCKAAVTGLTSVAMTAADTEPTDERLVAVTRAGDDEAFAALVRRHKSRGFGIAARFACDAHELEDLAQEIFLTTTRWLGALRGDAPFKHGLSRVAVHYCFDLLRKRRREGVQAPLDDPDLAAEESLDAEPAHEILEYGLSRRNGSGATRHHAPGAGGTDCARYCCVDRLEQG